MDSTHDEEGTVPPVELILYCARDGTVPLLEWLDTLPPKVQDKCLVRLERLEAFGHELRRPEADYLRDDIYELRVTYGHTQYRMLYFFHGRSVVVVSHGLKKERVVPSRDIDSAIDRKKQFIQNPPQHTFRPEGE